ncbi:MAG: class I SAM-dependent methyltransferase [Gemmatimonadales bacterium]|jgi:SAM-dependent methyltransferase
MKRIRYDDVADLYDLHVTVDLDIPFYIAEAQRSSGKVLELMAGTGRVSVPLVEAGIELTCVDASKGMLERLRAKLDARRLSATIHRADIRELDLRERFALAIVPFHSFSEITSPADGERTLESLVRHLSADGRLIVPLHNPAVRLREVDGALRLTSADAIDGGNLVVSGFERFDPQTRIVTRTQFYELFDERGGLESKRMLAMRFRLIWPEEFEDLAVQAGLEREALYGDYNYADFDEQRSPFMVWVLRRK